MIVHPSFTKPSYPCDMTYTMNSRRLLCWFAASALATAPLAAAPQKLLVDHAASKVAFEARATMHSFDGWIDSWDLDLRMPDGGELPDVVVFKGNGLTMTTDHKKRDEEMHHWMEHDKLPDVEFRVKSFSGTPAARVADGDLTLHGITMPISIPVTLKREGDALTVTGEVVVDTSKFGLPQFRKFGMLSVDTEVRVNFTVTGKLE